MTNLVSILKSTVSLRRGRAPTPLPAAAPGGRVRERCVAPAASAVTGPDASLA